LTQAKNLRILVLDACRDNPLAEELNRSLQGNRAFSTDRGLARIIPPSGMIISYATQAGRTAADGRGRNSPYTTAFLKNIEATQEIGAVFRHITADVYTSTQGRQLPELSLSLIGDFYLKGPAELVATAPDNPRILATLPSVETTDEGARVWTVMQNTTSIAVLEDFIRQFGTTPYGSLARARLDEMKNQAREAGARAKEAAEAKAAEAARIKAQQEAKAAEAARVKAEQETKAAAEAARAKAEQEARAAAEADRIRAEEVKAAAAKAAADAAQRPQNLAALTPPEQPTKPAAPSPGEIVRQLQFELRRVGCFTSDIDGEWNANSGHALELFNKQTGMNLDTKGPSRDALDAVRGKSSRVCPLICERGFHAAGEHCVATICKSGFTVGDDGNCQRIPERANRAAGPEPKQTHETKKEKAQPANDKVTICDKTGCRASPPGCRPQAQHGNDAVMCQ
jgi:chemotaxis protein histidine kinase CheA